MFIRCYFCKLAKGEAKYGKNNTMILPKDWVVVDYAFCCPLCLEDIIKEENEIPPEIPWLLLCIGIGILSVVLFL